MRFSGRSLRADGTENTQLPIQRCWRTKDLLICRLLLYLLPDLSQMLSPPRALSECLQGNPGRQHLEPQRSSALSSAEMRKPIDSAAGGKCAHAVSAVLKRTAIDSQHNGTCEDCSHRRICIELYCAQKAPRIWGKCRSRVSPQSQHLTQPASSGALSSKAIRTCGRVIGRWERSHAPK